MNRTEYSTLYYQDSSEGKQIYVFIENNSIKFKDSEDYITIPINKAEFKLGGSDSNFLIVISNISDQRFTLIIKDFEIIEELINACPEKKVEFESIKKEFNKFKRGKKYTILYYSGTIVAFILVIIFILNISISLIANIFPVSWEEKIGNVAVQSMIQGKEVKNKTLTDPIEKIGNYINSKSGNHLYDFKFYVVKDEQVNAFALPGGNVIVFTGLIEKSDSYEEVAGVLAHEIQHVYQKHGVKRILKRFGITLVLATVFGNVGSVFGEIGGSLAGLKFDRDEEREADKKGVKLLYDSGIDPKGMLTFFEKLKDVEGDLPENVSLLSTHPDTDERIQKLTELISQDYSRLPYRKSFDFNWDEIKKEAKELN